MLLEGRNAVICGDGSSIGGAVAREAARVFRAGRTLESLEEVDEQIRSARKAVEAARVDALDETVVYEHADPVAASVGGIDVSFNLTSYEDVQGTPLAEMSLEVFERPVAVAVRTRFLTRERRAT